MKALMHTGGSSLKMSSREIGELTGKRHDNVKRTIESLAGQGVIVRPQIEDEAGTDSQGRSRITQVYIFSGEQGKRDSIVIVAQLSPEFTARLVDRWQELERRVAGPALPDFTNPAAAARAWADEVEARQRLELEASQQAGQLAIAAPKAAALDRIAASAGTLTITEAAKVLGIKRDQLTAWMHSNGWIYRLNKSWVGYQAHIQSGDLQYKEATYTDESTGQETAKPYCHITQKGITKLAKALASHQAEPA
jgi:phage antirepressor YoqD-like protein